MGKANLSRILFGLFVTLLLLAPAPSSANAATAAPTQDYLSPWACTPPGIDGVAPFHEWATAPFIPMNHGRVYFQNDATHLYMLLDVVADTANDPPGSLPNLGDYFWLTFDVNTNGTIDARTDVNYSIYTTLPYAIGLQHYLGPATWTGLSVSAADFGPGFDVSFATPVPHRIWELAIPLSEIGAGPGAVIATGIRLHSQNPDFEEDMPPNFTTDFSDLVIIELAEAGCQVGMEKTVSATVANPGDILNFRIDYVLPGGATYTDLRIYDALPPGLIYLPGSATPPATYAGGVLTWDLGDVSASGSVSFQALVDRSACRRREPIIENIASLTASDPPVRQVSPATMTEIICRPIEFPTDAPPYAESEITVRPYPLVVGAPTMLCTEITNPSDQPQEVEVEFALANFGIGLPFTPIATAGNPRVIVIPPGETVTVCIQWVPTTPGHQCVQVTVSDANDQWPPIRSQRNLDVDEVLVPGQPDTFEIPVRNSTGATTDMQMVVRNACPGWIVSTDPVSMTLPAGAQQIVDVTVTPPASGAGVPPLGSGCTLDIEAWTLDAGGNLEHLLGGIRKVDEPLIPLGPPGERPFAEKEITVAPYPLVSGERAEVCVTLENPTDAEQEVTVEFMLSGFGIGLPFNRITPLGGANPQTVFLPPHSTVKVCIQFLPSTPGHHCLAVKLTMPNGYETWSRRNLDVAELLEPDVPEDVPIQVGNPTAASADIDLVVDNTCPGWTATVSPTLLLNVGPHSTDIRNVVLTVTPPPGLLGTNCHIDLLAYIDGRLIGGVRKIDRPPVAPPIDEPPWAEREITVSPDPPRLGQPAQVCAELVNPTPEDQMVDITFAAADFGAGVPFTNFRTVNNTTIPAMGKLIVCVPWTPAATGTPHRCLRIRIHQDGYEDIVSQRNVDLVPIALDLVLVPVGHFDLPPFLLHNPHPGPVPFFFNLMPNGLTGMNFQVMELLPAQASAGAATRALAPDEEILLDPNESREFFVRITPDGDPALVGDQHTLDVLPYANGMPLILDGIQSGVRYLFEEPRLYLPMVVR